MILTHEGQRQDSEPKFRDRGDAAACLDSTFMVLTSETPAGVCHDAEL